MKCKKIIFILIFLVIVNIIFINNTVKKEKNFTVEGVKLAVKVDGINQSNFPNIGEYNASVDCTGVTGTWNYVDWRLELSNMTSNSATCNINFVSAPNSHTKLNTKIIELVDTTQGTGQVVNEKGYRYEGKDPNNYVLFNGELWRIIGVFDKDTHGLTGQYLTKIIRNESIGGYSWTAISGGNDWSKCSLKETLNNYYYNGIDGTNDGVCYVGQSSNEIPFIGTCNFTGIGLNEHSRNMIENVIWKLGGYKRIDVTAEYIYNYEREGTVYSGNSTTWKGYIGLMYPSDYGYSALSSSCNRSTNLDNYYVSRYDNCVSGSWMFKHGEEWTMTSGNLNSQEAFFIDASGNLNMNLLQHSYFVRPVVYLKSSVYVISGEGSQTNPYVLGI